ncbi:MULTISPECIES: polysaccharide biosynthesis tyrosine autokinase [Bradyrhizobium]|uniref:polysaccharide biosynthesis tyrosine autokinase n=1 Tax=Bradyrhizobium TaxID=374 RepID=UPI00155ECFA7|nr:MULTISPECIES: polysaccharide biosynthesis tyrosine autokinase [Bradyrhizobium]MDD1519189.1 exopolysaccharide biosynthesis protein [Bradyrhizobium sp. WBAH30]MDD1543433.1 exopolysaccharide biosynthesis protein [Bradyrhizobium sp. WBAH41]MDD1557563.1 exopolysaccharide biosynthesis protein [Bradyrhizobium sp. WBAH23]MDD1564975.1 exopolysaccharide biosynthesis protein [Bradyrhizobium sp. WBAH33]MDD1590383.1 exopolysaccharide biosynthesis protein [Bradyrhizobium sp. WBAH42]
MLQVNKPTSEINRDFAEADGSPSQTLTSYLDIVRRQFPTMIAIVSACVILALLYLFTAAPLFTSTASMVIDTRKVQLFQQQSMLGDVTIDSATVETQVEILKSENISLAVIRDLHLTEDPEFTGSGAGLLGAIMSPVTGLFSSASAPSEFELRRKALERFASNRTIKRLGLTYVMEISFTSRDPQKAERIANAIADAYIVDQLEAKYQATRRASVWLQDRIKELRTQASVAQKAVVDFKIANNIVDSGGRLMNEQQLAEVNSQLVMAHAATAEAKARLDRMNDIVKQGIPDANVGDALKNDTIVKLRGQYVDMASKESIWAMKYGADHLAAVNLRRQMAEIKKNIQDELKRIQESYKSDYDIAQTREDAIKSSLASVVSESQLTNQAQIQLRELESNAQSYQAMYDNFLQRYMESVQQQSFPITEARIISAATPPLAKSSPKSSIILIAALVAGLVLGFGAAIAREVTDNVFRTTRQVEETLGTSCIAMLPALRNAAPLSSVPYKFARKTDDPQSDLLRYVVDNPLSRFSEAIRSLKVAVDFNSIVRENRLLAVTSTLPNEGKSTLSTNLAQLMAHGGARVILIDADLRNPSLSRELVPDAQAGLVDVVAQREQLENVLVIDPETKLAILPAGATSTLLHTNEVLGSKPMRELMGFLRSKFDYVVLDMPPMAPVVDARVTSSYVDGYIYVVEWGKTNKNVVLHNLRSAPEVKNKLLGVVLNKADTKLLARYESYQGRYYYQKYYARYGYGE